MTASVYLCGFMGCGKSHIGRLLAAELGRELVDLDKLIVDREGMSIPDIFAKYGEPHFRQLEAKYIRDLSTLRNLPGKADFRCTLTHRLRCAMNA